MTVRDVVRFLFDALAADLGRPIHLKRTLALLPKPDQISLIPEPGIAKSRVIDWHEWGGDIDRRKGVVQYWSRDRYGFGSREIRCQPLAEFAERTVIEEWTCDIQDIDGLEGSKSDLTQYATLDAFAEARCTEFIHPLTEEHLAKNLAWDEIRILRTEPEFKSDYFMRCLWNGERVFLVNDGGSHHFAAARYQASRLGRPRPVPLTGRLVTYRINPESLSGLLREFELFGLPSETVYGEFLEAMKFFGAPFGVYAMPRPHHHWDMVLLPRAGWRCRKVADILRAGGVLDVGKQLDAIVDRQGKVEARLFPGTC